MREWPKLAVLKILAAYKWAISPLLPPACRYVPTCSEYAMEAVERYGALRGGWMAAMRLLRCHPFVRGGYDPVVQAGEAGCHDTGCAAVARLRHRWTDEGVRPYTGGGRSELGFAIAGRTKASAATQAVTRN